MAYQAHDFSHILGMPGISDHTLEAHFKLYQGYVTQTNTLLERTARLVREGQDKSPEFAELRRRLGFEFDGMRLHEYYFDNLKGDGTPDTQSWIYQQIEQDFGSYAAWKQDFTATGLMRGVGWAILYYDTIHDCLLNGWVTLHQDGILPGCQLLLVMDVWEHAYYADYTTDRARYVDAFFDNLNWRAVADRFARNTEVQQRRKAA